MTPLIRLLPLIVILSLGYDVHAADIRESSKPETDCLTALFQRAGLRSLHIPRYVQHFRTNGLGEEVLYGLSFLDLVKFLQGKAFNITHAGDVFRLHTCISDRGDCVRHSFCINGGTCVYSDITNAHVCKCTPHFHGNMCQKRVQDRLGKLEGDVEQMSRITSNVGVSYTRWGKDSCNASSGSELVYNGYMAGQHHAHTGGGSNHVCLPKDPEYSIFRSGQQNHGYIYGAEFETAGYFAPYGALNNQNPECSVCYVSGRSSQIMIPGKFTCPPSWTHEYHGYLMSALHSGKGRTEYICVASDPSIVRGEARDTGGVLMYFVEGGCDYGLPCPPYANAKELTCAVCTR